MKLSAIFVCVSLIYLDSSEAIDSFTESVNQFASRLYNEVANISANNFVVSPLAVVLNLALTQFGCNGRSAAELKHVLRLSEENSEIQKEITNLLPNLTKSDEYNITVANKLYVTNKFNISSAFEEVASNIFSAEIENLDFAESGEASKVINNWIVNKSKNKIESLSNLEDLNESTSVILINALLFEALWPLRFKNSLTVTREFYKSPGEIVWTETMHDISDNLFQIGESTSLDAQILELALADDAALTIVVPKPINGLKNVENKIEEALKPQAFTPTSTFVQIPKFKIETDIDLRNPLLRLGVYHVFKNSSADLSGFTEEKNDLSISKVLQKSVIWFHEEGVTATKPNKPEEPKSVDSLLRFWSDFIVDRPFIFYISIKGVIVVVGRVTDPTV